MLANEAVKLSLGTVCAKTWNWMLTERKSSYTNLQILTEKVANIKSQGSDEVLTEPHEIKECWSNYFSSLLNVQQHQEELTTMSESTAVVEYHHITEHEVELAFEENVCDTCSIDVLILAADKLYIFYKFYNCS